MITLADRQTSAASRSQIYSLLATALAYPSEAGIAGIRTATSANTLEYSPELWEILEELNATIPEDYTTLQHSHQLLFPQIESQDTPGYETAYRGTEIFNHTTIMADIAGFYRAFGLKVGGERPDQITVELEFLAFLAYKEAVLCEEDDNDQADICVDAERAFLTDHLGDWGPELGGRIERHTDHDFFRVVGRLMDHWISGRLDDFGVEPDGKAGALSTSLFTEPSDWEAVTLREKP